jgi:hypothetical protein
VSGLKVWYVATSDPRILDHAIRKVTRCFIVEGGGWSIFAVSAVKFRTLEDAVAAALIEEDHGAYVIKADY